jgi:hypothetical protein
MAAMICFNMGWQHVSILSQTIASMNYFHINMSNSTNIVVHFEERRNSWIDAYQYGKGSTQFM